MSDENETNHSAKSESRPDSKKSISLAKQLTIWVPILAGIVAILVGICQITGWCNGDNGDGHDGPQATKFYGVVRYEGSGAPVPGANIRVKQDSESSELIGKGKTTPQGNFNFTIKAKPDQSVWVVVGKDKWVGFEGLIIPKGEKTIPFKKKP